MCLSLSRAFVLSRFVFRLVARRVEENAECVSKAG